MDETSEESQRQIHIDTIISRNRTLLSEWLATRDLSHPLDIPTEVLPVFIPRRIYELSDNPEQVTVIVAGSRREDYSKKQLLNFVIVERGLPQPVTNPKDWNNWQEEEKTSSDANGASWKYHLDPMLVKYKSLVQDGRLNLNDKIMLGLEYWVDDDHAQTLWEAEYQDREELRNKGVGKDFHNTQANVAKKLGFRFIGNWHYGPVRAYFTDKLGEIPFEKVKPEKADEILGNSFHRGSSTIQFLNPEDQNVYLKQ